MIFAILTLVLLVYTLLVQFRRYSIKAVLHPSVYFLGMWIISLISFILFYIAGLELIIYEKYLNELFSFISFTSICFLFFGRKESKIIRNLSLKLHLHLPFVAFQIFSYGLIISSIVGIITSGFDVAQNREIISQNLGRNNSGIIGQFVFLLGLIGMLSLPFNIYGGWKVGLIVVKGDKRINYIYFFPLISAVLDTIAGGGRSAIVSAGFIFMLGFFLGFLSTNNTQFLKRKIKLILFYSLVYILLFSIYSSFVSSERSKFGQGRENSTYVSTLLKEFQYLKPVSGVIEYFVFHFQGYQWRRLDIQNRDLEYGQNTFAFITHFNIPIFSQILGKNLSLQSAFDLKYVDNVKSTQENEYSGLIASSITSTVYIILFRDFGFFGTLAMIFLFVGLTQFLYKRLFYNQNNTFWSIILFIAVYKLWTQTFFNHHLAGAWLNDYIYSLILLEIINSLFSNKFRIPLNPELSKR